MARRVLKGVLRPLLQQPGGRLLVGEPGAAPALRRVQLQRPEPQRQSTTACRSSARAARASAAPTRRWTPNLKTPHTDEISAHGRAPVLGRVVDSRHLRPEDAERLRAVLLHADRDGVGRTADGAEDRGRRTASPTACSTCPTRSRTRPDTEYTNYPDSDFNYDTIEVRSTKRLRRASSSSRPAATTSGATSCGRPTSPTVGRRARCSTDPIGVVPQLSVSADRAEPAEDDDDTTRSSSGHYSCHLRHRHRG